MRFKCWLRKFRISASFKVMASADGALRHTITGAGEYHFVWIEPSRGDRERGRRNTGNMVRWFVRDAVVV